MLTLGRLCGQQQLWGKAQSYLEAALAIQPTRIVHIELARLFDQLDQLDQFDDSAEKSALAIRHYRAAAAL